MFDPKEKVEKEEALAADNMVFARGRVVSLGRDSYGHPSLTLFIRGSRDIEPSYVRFAVNNLDPSIRPEDYVYIRGHIEAYRYYNPVWDRNSYVQYLMADSVEVDEPILQFAYGQNGFAHLDPFVRLYLKGTVVSVRDSGEFWKIMTLRIRNENDRYRDTTIRTQYSVRMRVNDVKCEPGDTVCMTATYYTITKERNGQNVEFANVIVNDMSIIRKANGEVPPQPTEEERRAGRRRSFSVGISREQRSRNARSRSAEARRGRNRPLPDENAEQVMDAEAEDIIADKSSGERMLQKADNEGTTSVSKEKSGDAPVDVLPDAEHETQENKTETTSGSIEEAAEERPVTENSAEKTPEKEETPQKRSFLSRFVSNENEE